jgi:hypothetical protein
MKKYVISIGLLAVFFMIGNGTAAAQQVTGKQTSEFDQLIDRYFESLNERDAKRRGELIKQVWTEDAVQFVYPGNEDKGLAAIDATGEKVQRENPGAIIRRTSKIELVRDNYIRFNWEFGVPGRKPYVGGVDYAVIVGGKLRMVVGFFDYMKKPE